jgi:cyanophycinase
MQFKRFLIVITLCLGTLAHASTNLILIGGGKRPTEAMAAFVKAAGGNQAHIVIIPWASGSTQSAESIRNELAPFQPASIEVLQLYSNKKTNLSRYSKKIETQLQSATGIFFTGGDQNKLMKTMNTLELRDRMRAMYRNGVAFAGTSAGTAIMSKRMITGKSNPSVLDGTQVELSEGLGLLPEEIIVDQHFIVRQRFNRLASLILDQDETYGIGIDENNALHLINQRIARPIGPTQLTLIEKAADQSLKVTYKTDGEIFNLFGLKSSGF